MKKIYFVVLLCFIVGSLFAQQGTGYVIQKPVMKISAIKDGQNYQWENPDISISLDYQVGTFNLQLSNDDFRVNQTNQLLIADTVEDNRQFTLSGTFPINQIIDQLETNQSYNVELNLSNWDLNIDQTLNFNLTVTNPGTTQVNYRMFQMNGVLYNDELQLPAFNGFNNEVEIWILFNGFMNAD